MADVFRTITGNKKTGFIFEAGDNLLIRKEARDNAVKIEAETPVKATAVVANNLAYRLIANFYVKVQKPMGVYKVVSSKEEAVKWLKSLEI